MATLICGDAAEWSGRADLVLTNPYGPLPDCLAGVPAIVTNFPERTALCERWVRAPLHEIGAWGRSRGNRVWTTWPAEPVELDDLVEEEFAPGRGWFPLDLPLRLLKAFGRPGLTIIDPFMGRGTVGKAAMALGMDFIGIDIDPARVALAREYLSA